MRVRVDAGKWGIKSINDLILDGSTVLIEKERADPFATEIHEKTGLAFTISDNEDCNDGYVHVKFE